MDKNIIEDEIEVCNSILSKFKEEMLDCKKDFDRLKELESTDGYTQTYKKAFIAVKERHDDIAVSVKLIKNRLDKLKEDLKEAK